MISEEKIFEAFDLFATGTKGIGNWFPSVSSGKNSGQDLIIRRISTIDKEQLSKAQFNQLLVWGHLPSKRYGFFKYYWLKKCQETHVYDTTSVGNYKTKFTKKDNDYIISLEHLVWGFYRLHIDGLLYFGDVDQAYRYLCKLDFDEISKYFKSRRQNTDAIKKRGKPLEMENIIDDDRYLIGEMANSSYENNGQGIKKALHDAFDEFEKMQLGNGAKKKKISITIGDLLKNNLTEAMKVRQDEFTFSAEGILSEKVSSKKDLDKKIEKIITIYDAARKDALLNTKYYLSLVKDLDIYVATSMRNRENFRNMARFCRSIFSDNEDTKTAKAINSLHLRYFDPTLSAARTYEDKGLIECLMVKSAKILLYYADTSDSFGKDAEAAIALSSGKLVIFYCNEEKRQRIFKTIHPLSRLVNFSNGVATGTFVASTKEEVQKLIVNFFENKTIYYLEKGKNGSLLLKDKLTTSTVRLQTSDDLLRETFWNHYQILE